jgi:hypothetical protein
MLGTTGYTLITFFHSKLIAVVDVFSDEEYYW